MISNSLRNRDARLPVLTINHLWTAAPLFLIILKGFIFPLPLLDFWWHLRMGQVILEKWVIPRIDLFSATAAGKPFIVQNWLAEVLLYLGYRAGGFPLLVFFNGLLLVATLLPVYCLCRKSTKKLGAAVFSASLVAICIPGNLRPQIFSFLFFSVFYWVLLSYHGHRQGRIWLLPALMIVWVNLHGAFVVGLGLITVFFFCESLRFFSRRCPDALAAKEIRNLALVLVLCALATMANPEGYGIYDYIRTVVHDPSSQQFVAEWQPPSVRNIQGSLLFYLPFFLLTFVLIASEKRPGLTEMTLYAAFSAFGIAAGRNSIWFLIIGAPLLARYFPHVGWAQLFARPQRDPKSMLEQAPVSKKQSPILNYAIALASFAVMCIQSPWLRELSRPGSLVDPATPVAGMDFIERHALSGNIYHPQIYGDYLIWRLWPRHGSFFDGRVHLFGEGFVRDYRQIPEDSHWEERLSKYNVRYLFLPKDADKRGEKRMINEAGKSSRWKPLYEDRLSILFEKVSFPDASN